MGSSTSVMVAGAFGGNGMPSSAGNAVICLTLPLKARCSWSTGMPPSCVPSFAACQCRETRNFAGCRANAVCCQHTSYEARSGVIWGRSARGQRTLSTLKVTRSSILPRGTRTV